MSDHSMAAAANQLFTIRQVAQRYGVAVPTIRRWEVARQNSSWRAADTQHRPLVHRILKNMWRP